MNYDLALELKNAGFPQPNVDQANGDLVFPGNWVMNKETGGVVYHPHLSELIEACEPRVHLFVGSDGAAAWGPYASSTRWVGSTPEEAVARLYLQLKRDSIESNAERSISTNAKESSRTESSGEEPQA